MSVNWMGSKSLLLRKRSRYHARTDSFGDDGHQPHPSGGSTPDGSHCVTWTPFESCTPTERRDQHLLQGFFGAHARRRAAEALVGRDPPSSAATSLFVQSAAAMAEDRAQTADAPHRLRSTSGCSATDRPTASYDGKRARLLSRTEWLMPVWPKVDGQIADGQASGQVVDDLEFATSPNLRPVKRQRSDERNARIPPPSSARPSGYSRAHPVSMRGSESVVGQPPADRSRSWDRSGRLVRPLSHRSRDSPPELAGLLDSIDGSPESSEPNPDAVRCSRSGSSGKEDSIPALESEDDDRSEGSVASRRHRSGESALTDSSKFLAFHVLRTKHRHDAPLELDVDGFEEPLRSIAVRIQRRRIDTWKAVLGPP
ncbi:hypothetical protein ACQY0O_004544 [Thecaphora frezii]